MAKLRSNRIAEIVSQKQRSGRVRERSISLAFELPRSRSHVQERAYIAFDLTFRFAVY